jgi:hypothetical protein
MMGGMLLAILLYRPIYKQMFETTNVKNKTEIVAIPSFGREYKLGTTKSVMVACKNIKDGGGLPTNWGGKWDASGGKR